MNRYPSCNSPIPGPKRDYIEIGTNRATKPNVKRESLRYSMRMAAPSTMVVVKTVLVADDTEFVRDRFRTAIEAAGHRAVVARSRR